ncbi:ATP-binding protein [Streptomyces sp. TRM72054]|uniref:AlbA family DNA-binding domain-containing protein n=1 Tax=Streptomyces sp. TRM72054 TaxID=2870562 RepID=UPI001C8C5609|nr:ATP-binding protein [Streptomyces sp. TRM72054]MBX9397442.1 ATP-binding protein [Streptomyces sp. TRM72054]
MTVRIPRVAQLMGADFDQVERSHLAGLCSQSAAEDIDLDFKQDNGYTKDGDGQDELAKDVTAMANARGGLIIVGIAEDGQGNAGQLCPVKIGDKIHNQLVSALRSRVFPFLPPDFRIRMVADDATTPELGYILIGIPRSPIAPHAVRPVGGKGQQRYGYARRLGRTTAWLDESEIAALYRDRFRQAEGHTQRVRGQLRDDTAWLAESRHDGLVLQLSLVPSVGAERRIDRTFVQDVRTFLGTLTQPGRAPSAAVPRALLSQPPQIRRGRMRVPGAGIHAVWHSDGGATLRVTLASDHDAGVLNLTRLEHQVLCTLHLACAYAEWAGAYGDADVMASTASPPEVHLDRTPPNGSARYVPGIPVASDAGSPCHHIGYLEALANGGSQLRSMARNICMDLLADYGVYEPTLLRDDGDVRSERLAVAERLQIEAWLASSPEPPDRVNQVSTN